MRVLVADGDAVSQLILESLLVSWGHEVVVVADGQSAWDLLRHPEGPRVAVLSWSMPGMTGPEVCRLARAHRSDRQTYTILIATKAGSGIAKGMDAGADECLPKPFHAADLRERLGNAERLCGGD